MNSTPLLHIEQSAKHTEQYEASEKASLGFWIYLMTDCVLFASLFAVYAVLHHNTAGGPSGMNLFKLPYVLLETLVLLTSSFTSGLGMLAAQRRQKTATYGWFLVTFLLGLTFLVLELTEFHHLAAEGNSWHRSGFLSAYFTLVGTHGLHITAGLLWMLVLLIRLAKDGFKRSVIHKFMLLSTFWHFLDLIWIFIFTIVYLFGARGV